MRAWVAAASLAAALVSGPMVALAGPPVDTTAHGMLTSHTQTLVRAADGNLTFMAVDHVVFTGGITGQPVDTYAFTVHPDGSITGHGIETCAMCTIGGRTGSFSEVFSFTATPNFASFEGHFAVQDSGGGLSGLRGEGTFQGAGFSEAISLRYHFEPNA